jgi:thiamine biosynthesis lipoprotein
MWLTMNTYATLSVPWRDRGNLAAYTRLMSRVTLELEKRLSLFLSDSELTLVNNRAGMSPVPVSKDTYVLLEAVQTYARMSRGCFDPTVAPLVRLWGFRKNKDPEDLPSREAIEATRTLVGYQHLVLTNQTAYLDTLGMRLDLGGIAKGHAVDACYDALAGLGVPHFMVVLGGNIRCRGKADGTPWRVGIQNPFVAEEIVGYIPLPSGMAVATSGNYEKYVTIKGKRYAHIIDPRNGRPVSGVAGVTVLCPNGLEADALSTACFVLGLEETREVFKANPGREVLFIPDEQPLRILISPGMKAHFLPAPDFKDAVQVF